MCSTRGTQVSPGWVPPFGYLWIFRLHTGSPELFAVCHALLRLLAPRHPPYALSSLTHVKPRNRNVSRSIQLLRCQVWLCFTSRCSSSLDQAQPLTPHLPANKKRPRLPRPLVRPTDTLVSLVIHFKPQPPALYKLCPAPFVFLSLWR